MEVSQIANNRLPCMMLLGGLPPKKKADTDKQICSMMINAIFHYFI